jgi:hypothetical protein
MIFLTEYACTRMFAAANQFFMHLARNLEGQKSAEFCCATPSVERRSLGLSGILGFAGKELEQPCAFFCSSFTRIDGFKRLDCAVRFKQGWEFWPGVLRKRQWSSVKHCEEVEAMAMVTRRIQQFMGVSLYQKYPRPTTTWHNSLAR